MKKLHVLAITLLFSKITISQTNFIWEKTDSVNKPASQIYSDTKMFIATTWKSAKDVIQNDDKENGMLLIKGVFIKNFNFMMAEYVYVYNYSITFKIKENRFKIILDNVSCERAYVTGSGKSVTKIEPFEGDNCPETGTMSAYGLPKKKAIVMMSEVKQHLQSIVDKYVNEIKTPTSKNDW